MRLIEFPPTHFAPTPPQTALSPLLPSAAERFPPHRRVPHHCQMFKSNMQLQCIDNPRGGITGCSGTWVRAWAARAPPGSAANDPCKCATPCVQRRGLCCLRPLARGRWSRRIPRILWENSQGPIAVYPSWRLLCHQPA